MSNGNEAQGAKRYVIRAYYPGSGGKWYVIIDTQAPDFDDHAEMGVSGINATHFGDETAYDEIYRRLKYWYNE